MKLHFRPISEAAILLTLAMILTSCATKKDVQAAVASTNETIVDLLVEQPGLRLNAATDTNWRQPVAQIEKIIQSNPDQPIMVNHLRVRQAWVLTVYGQHNIANEVWRNVDPKSLVTEREANLYANRKGLTWWMDKTQSGSVFIEDSETSLARSHIARFDSSANAVESHDLEAYFATLSGSVSLKLLSGAGTGSELSLEEAAADIPSVVTDLVAHFTTGEKTCARSSDGTGLNSPSGFRNCAYLKKLYSEFEVFSDKLIARGVNVDLPEL